MSSGITGTVQELQDAGILLVEDGNHGEYRPRRNEFAAKGTAFIRAADMVDGRIDFRAAAKISDVALERIRKGVGQPGDVVLSHKGTVGKLARAPLDAPPFVCSPQTTFWRVLDVSKIEPRFLFYYMQSRGFRHLLDARKGETDMADYVSLTNQRSLHLALPKLSEQQRIAHNLGTLDDKIELNRRMNRTLEAIARAIFKSWFVDFDPVHAKAEGREPVGMDPETAALFPNSFQDSRLGKIPKGWEGHTLNQVLSVGLGGSWGKDEPTDKAKTEVVCLRGVDLHDLAERRTPEPPHRWLTARQAASRQLNGWEILVEASGSFCGRSMLVFPHLLERYDAPLLYSNFCKRLDLNGTRGDAAIAWMWLRHLYDRDVVSAYRTGTAFPNLDLDGLLMNAQLAFPPEELSGSFADLLRILRAPGLEAHSQKLASTRDVLLPRLLSGELAVTEGAFDD